MRSRLSDILCVSQDVFEVVIALEPEMVPERKISSDIPSPPSSSPGRTLDTIRETNGDLMTKT